MATALHRQVEFLALNNPIIRYPVSDCILQLAEQWTGKSRYVLGVVDPEEVRVEDSLDNACDNGDRVVETGHLSEIPVEPVGDVQSTISPKRKKIMGGDGLCLASSLQHEELRENGDRLQPDRKGP